MRKLCGTILAAAVAATALGDSLGNIGDVRLKGRLGERLDAMIEKHVAARDVDYITAPFMEKTETKGWWQTEFWGKWMHAAVPYAKLQLESGVGERLKSKVERGIERMLASQEPCGYIGNYPDELRCGEGWDVWGMKYTMMGLLHYYDATKSKPALDACCRLCDYVIGEIGPSGKRGRELCRQATGRVTPVRLFLSRLSGSTSEFPRETARMPRRSILISLRTSSRE